MSNSTTWVGMDVHKESIVVAAVSGTGATTARWETPNTSKGKMSRGCEFSPFVGFEKSPPVVGQSLCSLR